MAGLDEIAAENFLWVFLKKIERVPVVRMSEVVCAPMDDAVLFGEVSQLASISGVVRLAHPSRIGLGDACGHR